MNGIDNSNSNINDFDNGNVSNISYDSISNNR